MLDKLIRAFPREIVDEAIKMHGHLAPGIILGFKLALRALKELQPPKEDNIIFTTETTRCIPDGLQCINRYLSQVGRYHVYHRTYDVGKLAIQVTKNHEDLFRLVLNETYVKQHPIVNAWANLGTFKKLPPKEVEDAMWAVDLDQGFLKKPFKKKIKASVKGKEIVDCPVCGERTLRLSMVLHDGQYVCKTCAFFQK